MKNDMYLVNINTFEFEVRDLVNRVKRRRAMYRTAKKAGVSISNLTRWMQDDEHEISHRSLVRVYIAAMATLEETE